jgi:phenylalanyl-tRNA synthetase beta chain
MCEIEFDKLSYGSKTAQKTSKYQVSFKDLSLIMPKNMAYEKVKSVIDSAKITNLIRFYLVDKYTDDTLGENMSLSIRFVLQSDEKTLEDDDITSAMDSILKVLDDNLSIGLR